MTTEERHILEELVHVWVGDRKLAMHLAKDINRAEEFKLWVTELYKCQFLPFTEQVELKLRS